VTGLREIYARQIAQRGFQADPAQLAAVECLEELRQQLITSTRKQSRSLRWLKRARKSAAPATQGVYLWGGVGRGKTWLMDMFFQSLPFPERRRRHFHRFMQDVHTELKSLGEVESPLEQMAERVAQEARVVCFDELFVTDIADAMILGTLFDALIRRDVALVFTSNVPPRDLYKSGLQRQRFLPAIALLERHMRVLAVDGGSDYRLRQLTQAGTYLRSSEPDTAQRLEALFNELSDGDAESEDAVEIQGRRIPIVRESENVIWFDFEALCEGPRGAADYIEIARDYQSVLVSTVPILDETRENAARRFIALVDELYDHGVNLVVSAAAGPRELYRGERLQHEFHRTTSRLIEMQSQEYLAREHRA
jgi:cell division protein ZapE